MFKTKKTKVEKVVEEATSAIEYFKEAIERREKLNEEDRLKILKEQLLIDELKKQDKVNREIDTMFDKFLKLIFQHDKKM